MEWSGPPSRVELTRRFGVITLDQAHAHWDCPRCGAYVKDPSLYVVGTVLYQDLEDLIRESRQALSLVTHGKQPQCCGGDVRLRAADYHAYQGEPERDLVLRWTEGAAAPELLWWDGATYAVAEPDEEGEIVDSLYFLTDAVFRKAAARMEVEGIEAAVDDIVVCRQECAGLREILFFVEPLARAGYREMAEGIVEEYLDEHPGDERATALMARLDEDDEG